MPQSEADLEKDRKKFILSENREKPHQYCSNRNIAGNRMKKIGVGALGSAVAPFLRVNGKSARIWGEQPEKWEKHLRDPDDIFHSRGFTQILPSCPKKSKSAQKRTVDK
jgi:hypothetical protein